MDENATATAVVPPTMLEIDDILGIPTDILEKINSSLEFNCTLQMSLDSSQVVHKRKIVSIFNVTSSVLPLSHVVTQVESILYFCCQFRDFYCCVAFRNRNKKEFRFHAVLCVDTYVIRQT